MQIDITNLLINKTTNIKINDQVSIPSAYLTNTLIDDLNGVLFQGNVKLDEENNVVIMGSLSGTMILKDDVTLEQVQYHFDTYLEESLATSEYKLDITDILWQNILTEIPSKVRSTEGDIELKGDGWRLISEDIYNEERKNSQNPFANLAEIIETKEEK